MSKKSLFFYSATTSFLTVLQITLSKEVMKAKRDADSSVRRKNLQQTAERLLAESESTYERS